MNIGGIKLLMTGRVALDLHWEMKAHLHPFHEIIVPVQGRMRVKSAGQCLDAAAGDVLLYPARVVHAEWSHAETPVETLYLCFQASSVRDHTVVMIQDRSGRIRQMMRWLYEEQNFSDPYIREERQLLIATILKEFSRNRKHRDHPMVLRIRQYIHDHIAEPLTLDSLARQAQWSRCHFLRTYKALTGRTPMEDVRMIRAHYARELILSTGLPLKEIASRTGLGNEYSMSRIFRRYFNMPPGAWRRHRGLSS